jgi:geranylgeranyl transferase type-2 subunit beta
MSSAPPATASPSLLVPLHVEYIQSLGKNADDLTYHLTAHLRMNAVYWGLTALHVLGHPDALDRAELLKFVDDCWDDAAGAFGAAPAHDAHVHATLSAIQILIMLDALDTLPAARVDRIVKCAYAPCFGLNKAERTAQIVVAGLQQPSGVIAGDAFGEADARLTYCAVSTLTLLGRVRESGAPGSPLFARNNVERGGPGVDVDKVAEYMLSCQNFDGGFGAVTGAESHGAMGTYMLPPSVPPFPFALSILHLPI